MRIFICVFCAKAIFLHTLVINRHRSVFCS
nr:MAG TPA: hypothetical protein [Caudoviricetes sp.]